MVILKKNILLISILVWFELHNAYAVQNQQETENDKYDLSKAIKALRRVNPSLGLVNDKNERETLYDYKEPSEWDISKIQSNIKSMSKKLMRSPSGKPDHEYSGQEKLEDIRPITMKDIEAKKILDEIQNEKKENENYPKIEDILQQGCTFPPVGTANVPTYVTQKEKKTNAPTDKETNERKFLFSYDGLPPRRPESGTQTKRKPRNVVPPTEEGSRLKSETLIKKNSSNVPKRYNAPPIVDEKEKIKIEVPKCVGDIKKAFNMEKNDPKNSSVSDYIKQATLNMVVKDVKNNYSAGRYFWDLRNNLNVENVYNWDQFCDTCSLNDHPIIAAAPQVLQYICSTLNWLTTWIQIKPRDDLISEIRRDCKEKLYIAGFKKDKDKTENIRKIFSSKKLSDAIPTNKYFPTKYLNHISVTLKASMDFLPNIFCEKICKEGVTRRDLLHPTEAYERQQLFGLSDMSSLHPGVLEEVGNEKDFKPGNGDPELARAISMYMQDKNSSVPSKPKSEKEDSEGSYEESSELDEYNLS